LFIKLNSQNGLELFRIQSG